MIQYIEHPLEPIYDQNSKILILGTMPSPKSRENGFYYSHPQNRFWKVTACLLEQLVPIDKEEKKMFLLKNGIALWDVLKSCSINNAADASIQNPVPNDIATILHEVNIKAVFTTGAKAYTLYQKLCFPHTNIPALALPSTSPANCRLSLENLAEAYKIILNYLSVFKTLPS